MFVTMICLKIIIHGKVYKTGLRYFLKQQASRLKIKGSVFYLNDQSVVLTAMGEQPDIEEFLRYCHLGNKDSIIEKVNVKPHAFHSDSSFMVVDDVSQRRPLNNIL